MGASLLEGQVSAGFQPQKTLGAGRSSSHLFLALQKGPEEDIPLVQDMDTSKTMSELKVQPVPSWRGALTPS